MGTNAADEVIFLGGGRLQMGTEGLAHFSCSGVPRKPTSRNHVQRLVRLKSTTCDRTGDHSKRGKT